MRAEARKRSGKRVKTSKEHRRKQPGVVRGGRLSRWPDCGWRRREPINSAHANPLVGPIRTDHSVTDHAVSQGFPLQQPDCAQHEAQAKVTQFLPKGCLDEAMMARLMDLLCWGTLLSVHGAPSVDARQLMLDQEMLQFYDSLVPSACK